MRYLPAIAARLYKPMFVSGRPHDYASQTSDPIARDLQAAVLEHERVGAKTRTDYRNRLDEMMDDLFSKLDASFRDDKRG